MHAIYTWLMSGDWRPTFSAVATFLTAIVALIAAVIAYCGILRQISAQKQAALGETSRQRSAIARALRAEIADFRTLHVEPFMRKDTGAGPLGFFDRTFPVYESNTARVGELGAEACEAVVHFYDLAREYFCAVDRYLGLQRENLYLGESMGARDARLTGFFGARVLGPLNDIKAAAFRAEHQLLGVEEPPRAAPEAPGNLGS